MGSSSFPFFSSYVYRRLCLLSSPFLLDTRALAGGAEGGRGITKADALAERDDQVLPA